MWGCSKIRYYMCDESEYVFTLDDFRVMLKDEGEISMKIEEVERDIGGNMWCRRTERFVEKGDCGRVCDTYEPCNGKNGRCRNLENGFKKTGKKYLLTLSELVEIREICGFCTEYDSDLLYCPHQEGEMYPEDTCDGFQSEEDLEAQRVDAAERENHRREVEGDIE